MTFKEKIISFVKHLIWHIGRGMPKSSKSLIMERYAICSECEYLDTKIQECKQCGCNINTQRIFMNKLAWSDQKCPEGKW